MINNIDEAIKHYEEETEGQYNLYDCYLQHGEQGDYVEDCLKCASEHKQLAEWLKKLKAYEEAREEIECLPIVWREDAGVRKCIGILDKHLMEVKADERGSN